MWGTAAITSTIRVSLVAAMLRHFTSLERAACALQSSQWDLSSDICVLGDKDLGYSDALQTVWWDDVIAQSDLLLSSPVVAIDTSGSDVIVTDANLDRHAARQVIVTVSTTTGVEGTSFTAGPVTVKSRRPGTPTLP